jgi:hypothetical protein
MQSEPKDRNAANQLLLTCVGLSVIFGIVVGERIDFESLGKLRLVSLTGHGAVTTLGSIVVAILMVVSGARLTVVMRPSKLAFLGAFLVVAGPAILAHVSSGTKSTSAPIPFLLLAILEFIGAAFLGVGLRELLWRKPTPAMNEGPKGE